MSILHKNRQKFLCNFLLDFCCQWVKLLKKRQKKRNFLYNFLLDFCCQLAFCTNFRAGFYVPARPPRALVFIYFLSMFNTYFLFKKKGCFQKKQPFNASYSNGALFDKQVQGYVRPKGNRKLSFHHKQCSKNLVEILFETFAVSYIDDISSTNVD